LHARPILGLLTFTCDDGHTDGILALHCQNRTSLSQIVEYRV